MTTRSWGRDTAQRTRDKEHLGGKTTKAGDNHSPPPPTPRVILLDLSCLLIMHTNTRILTQEALHRLLFVHRWSHARAWAGPPASRPLTSKARAGIGSGRRSVTRVCLRFARRGCRHLHCYALMCVLSCLI